MKLSHIILEVKEFEKQEQLLKQELDSNFKGYEYAVTMGMYDQDRDDDDELKGKGFGSIVFTNKDDVDESTFKKIVAFLKVMKKFEITGTNRFYDSEPGERDIFPTIKFDFNL